MSPGSPAALLPAVHTDDEWDAVVGDDAIVRPAAERLAAQTGLGGRAVRRYPGGSVPVFAVGDHHVLKLYPTCSADDAVTEARVLAHVHGRLPVATPELHAHGECGNGWRYLLMSQLPGEDLAQVWPRVPRSEQLRLAGEVGELLATLHALDPAPLTDVIGPPSWGAFLDKQRAGAVQRQRERALADAWLDRIPAFLASVTLTDEPRRVLLHTEVMREHLLIDPAGWTLSGLVDFEPAMIGDPAYDFVAVGLFVSRGDPHLLRRTMSGYGRRFAPRELLAYTLLHVYSNLPRYLAALPAPPQPTLDSLAETWFGTAQLP